MPTTIISLPPQDVFLRLPQVLAVVGLKKSSWYKLIQNEDAPSQIRLSSRCSVWSKNEIDHWVICQKNGTQWKPLECEDPKKTS